MNYLVLAYYQIQPIENPHAEVKLHKEFLSTLDAKARIYISEQGINGQASFAEADAQKYMDWMHGREEFKNVKFKIHIWHEQAFPRLIVKYRRQLVAIDRPVNQSFVAQHISPQKFREELESEDKPLVLDVRNEYETRVGYFDGARLPKFDTFREFNNWADELKQEFNPKEKKVLMYCTGGIRCEFYSALLKESGFENVYQLDGGVIDYGLKEGGAHWKGKLFVFDDRLTVPLNDEKTEIVGKCHKCEAPSESYYNCANIDCNTLFLCCPSCLKELAGTCQPSCQSAERLRPYEDQNPHKPFLKKHHYLAKNLSVKENS